jgi:ribonucleoside-diphosphate reductase alpha chain
MDRFLYTKIKMHLAAFFKENVEPNTMTFSSVQLTKINYLIEHDYLEEEFIRIISSRFIEELYQFLI